MAKEQRYISVSEFFEKNKHLLGFDNPSKALLMVVKEAVDNSLDACEDAGVLPDINVEIKAQDEETFKIMVEDNGPGIVKEQIANVFGKLLYGSRFGRGRQARGQQGIGISAAVLYAHNTTGKDAVIESKTGKRKPTNVFHIHIDVMKNEAVIDKSEVKKDSLKDHGTRITLFVKAKYRKTQSVDDYMKQTAIVNPYAQIKYVSPDNKKYFFKRTVKELPVRSKEIKPHPYGMELGILMRMLKATKSKNVSTFMRTEFTRVGGTSAKEICKLAGVNMTEKTRNINRDQAERLLKAMQTVKLQRPPTDCLSPVNQEHLLQGLQKEFNADFIATTSRDPSVYKGNPFQIEAGIVYGGDLDPDGSVRLMRYANKVPLLYQQSACAIWKAATTIKWRRYGMGQERGSLPSGPAVIVLHMASVWAPFVSESKEAIASYPEIINEMRLALQDCARKLRLFISKRQRAKREKYRLGVFQDYFPLIEESAKELAEEKGKTNIKPILDKVVKSELVRIRTGKLDGDIEHKGKKTVSSTEE
jgi:DNA topoisomerase-6 subunit B